QQGGLALRRRVSERAGRGRSGAEKSDLPRVDRAPAECNVAGGTGPFLKFRGAFPFPPHPPFAIGITGGFRSREGPFLKLRGGFPVPPPPPLPIGTTGG